jgi:hypothetical protein
VMLFPPAALRTLLHLLLHRSGTLLSCSFCCCIPGVLALTVCARLGSMAGVGVCSMPLASCCPTTTLIC